VVGAAAGVRTGGTGGAAAVVLGVGALATAAALAPRRSLMVVTPAALLVGLRVGATLTADPTGRRTAVVLGAAAALLAVAPLVVPRRWWPAPAAALKPWALVAATGSLPGVAAASGALAVGALLAGMLGGPVGVVAALPGGAVLAHALANGAGGARAVVSLLLVATVGGLVMARPAAPAPRVRRVDAAVAALAAWFVVRPTSWTVARIGDVRAYTSGVPLAAAAAVVAGAALVVSGCALVSAPLAPWIVAPDVEDSAVTARVQTVTVAAAALLGLVAAALVRSPRL
jgi:hypothetical protein